MHSRGTKFQRYKSVYSKKKKISLPHQSLSTQFLHRGNNYESLVHIWF